MQQLMKTLKNDSVLKLVDQLESITQDLPHLPKGIVDFLVKINPWLAAVGGLLLVLGSFNFIQIGLTSPTRTMALLMPDAFAISPTYYLLSGILMMILAFMSGLAFAPLKAQSFDGWLIMFWMIGIYLVDSIIGIAYGVENIFMTLLGLAIGIYILFELKPAYSDKGTAKKS